MHVSDKEAESKSEYFVYIKMINVVQVDSRSARQQGHILISVLIISDLYRTTVADLFYPLCLCQFIQEYVAYLQLASVGSSCILK